MTDVLHGQGPGPGPGPAGLPWPAGRPAQIREAARRLDELGRGIEEVGVRTRALEEVDGWTGPAAVTWTDAVTEHATALDPGGPSLQAAARALHALADEMEEARRGIGRLAEEVLDADAVADRTARHAVEVRRAWLGGLDLAPGSWPPGLVPPDRVLTADAAALAAADDAAEVLRRCVTRARARRDEVRACDRRTAALLAEAAGAAPGDRPVAWCGTTTGPRPPCGPKGYPGASVQVAWAAGPASEWLPAGPAGQGGDGPEGQAWAEQAGPDWVGPEGSGWVESTDQSWVEPAGWMGAEPVGHEWAAPADPVWTGPEGRRWEEGRGSVAPGGPGAVGAHDV